MRYLIALLAACGSTPAPVAPDDHQQDPQSEPTIELTKALEPLGWWLGDWTGEHGEEHWIPVSGAIYGVALNTKDRWEVMIIDDAEGPGDPDGIVRFFAMPDGTKSVEFRAEPLSGTSATFANPAHDDPKKITYARTGDALKATLQGDAYKIAFDFTRADLPVAMELMAADSAFASDTAKRGVDGWMAAFAPDGAMMRKGERITGAAIGEMMKPVLADGTLQWKPTDSGVRGTLGFTVGKAQFIGTASQKIEWRSTYVTIWKQQPDQTWKVLFDIGRPVNEPPPQ